MEGFASVNSIELHYFDSAPGNAELTPVVLLHGLGGCREAWEFQERHLLERGGVRLIVPDLRGHGRSSKPHLPYTVEVMSCDIARLLERLNLRKVVLVGHSLGGMVSYHLAATRPDLVGRLIIINSFSRIPAIRPKAIVKLFYRTGIIYGLGLKAWAWALAWELLPRADQAELRRKLVALSRFSDDRTAYMNSLKAAVKADLRPLLPLILCPVKLLASDRDYTPLPNHQADADRINSNRNRAGDQRATMVAIPRSRHLSLWDQAELINGEIASFLPDRF